MVTSMGSSALGGVTRVVEQSHICLVVEQICDPVYLVSHGTLWSFNHLSVSKYVLDSLSSAGGVTRLVIEQVFGVSCGSLSASTYYWFLNIQRIV